LISRTFDVERINRVLRDPSVLASASIGQEVPEDISDFVENEKNVCLFTEHGGFMCFQFQPGWFDVHAAFLPEGRGKYALAAFRQAISELFSRHDARCLVAFIPDTNPAAGQLARWVGFRKDFPAECFGVPGVTMKLERESCLSVQ